MKYANPPKVSPLSSDGRLLLGPGPSNVSPAVLRAMSVPLVGHLDKEFLDMMETSQEMLRYLFQTHNQLTIPISATGSAGMEACFVNLVEPGDKVLVGINGVFGKRMADVAQRCQAEVVVIEKAWGEIFTPAEVIEAVNREKPKLVALVHAETSTGALQPLEEIGAYLKSTDSLLLIDCVTSLAGTPVLIDEWSVDAAYSGTQKCLSAPPGLAPITFSPKAEQVLKNRKSKVQSWYLDVSMLAQYWGDERVYHHTAPISMLYGLYEALRLVCEEGLENRWNRHRDNHRGLAAGLQALGLDYNCPEDYRLPQLNAVKVPDGVDDVKVRQRLWKDHQIEIGGGLGDFKGKVWRIGLMGESSTQANVLSFLGCLEQALLAEGYQLKAGSSVAAANEVFNS